MAKYINWKSNWLNGNFQLFVEGVQKGAINFEMWRSNAETIFDDKNYFYKNVGFCQSQTNVFDKKTNELVANITYNSWKSTAIINLKSGEQYEWKSTGFWKSQWTVSNYKDANIMYSSSSNTGAISADTDNDLLIVTGLFIKGIFNKRAAAIVACFVPLFVVITNRNH